jgi:hypothetical protein
METIKFRVRNPMKWLSPLISVVYTTGVAVLVIQNFEYLRFLTSGSSYLFMLLLAPAFAPLFLLLWLLGPARQVHMGNGQLVLAWGNDVLGQIAYPEIAHMRLTGPKQHLDIFDRAGVHRLHIEPMDLYYGKIATVVDFMRTQLPHLENTVEQKKGKNVYVDRYIDFPPQPAQAPQQSGYQPPQGQHSALEQYGQQPLGPPGRQ